MSKKVKWQVPFDENGNLIHNCGNNVHKRMMYVRGDTWQPQSIPIKWKEQYEFEAELTYSSFYRGQSAAYTEWKSSKGVTFPMSLRMTDELLKKVTLRYGSVFGIWGFTKHGNTFGIRLIKEVLKDGTGENLFGRRNLAV